MDWMEIGPVVGAFVVVSKALDFAIDTYKTRKNGNLEAKIYEKVTGLETDVALIGQSLSKHFEDHDKGKV